MIDLKTVKPSNIFVSRPLSPTSPILEFLASQSLHYEARSLIDFEKIEFDVPPSEWLFFYSKTAVNIFLSSNTIDLSKYKYAFFGKATARHFENQTGITPAFVGNAIAHEVCLAIVSQLAPLSITFLVGKHSLRSVQTSKNANPAWAELIIYDHQQKNNEVLEHYTYAIITSPMNAAAFVSNQGTADKYISIGKTTKRALSTLIGDETIHTADVPSEEGIVKTLSQLIADR